MKKLILVLCTLLFSVSYGAISETIRVVEPVFKTDEAIIKAAQDGDAVAQYILAEMYAEGKRVTKDEQEAVMWYLKAAEKGHASAAYQIGMMYTEGRGVEKNWSEAVKWYRKALVEFKKVNDEGERQIREYRQHKIEAITVVPGSLGYESHIAKAIGDIYDNGGWGVEKDEVEAIEWYRKAAEQGNAEAQYKLGKMYSEGVVVEKNMTEAVKWFLEAAEHGKYALGPERYKEVCYLLASCYMFGDGVQWSIFSAVKWWWNGNVDSKSFVIGLIVVGIALLVVGWVLISKLIDKLIDKMTH